jgi:hypothetical protein
MLPKLQGPLLGSSQEIAVVVSELQSYDAISTFGLKISDNNHSVQLLYNKIQF